ncbi:MAG: hypothetical protein IPK76_19325 [Lewinellaceae bacterium]|nr:hypothetical protein [Lewinellaceae bacterium]
MPTGKMRDHLDKGEAAVEFIRYRYYDPDEADSTICPLVLLADDTCPH